jgi:hypothetical protein
MKNFMNFDPAGIAAPGMPAEHGQSLRTPNGKSRRLTPAGSRNPRKTIAGSEPTE